MQVEDFPPFLLSITPKEKQAKQLLKLYKILAQRLDFKSVINLAKEEMTDAQRKYYIDWVAYFKNFYRMQQVLANSFNPKNVSDYAQELKNLFTVYNRLTRKYRKGIPLKLEDVTEHFPEFWAQWETAQFEKQLAQLKRTRRLPIPHPQQCFDPLLAEEVSTSTYFKEYPEGIIQIRRSDPNRGYCSTLEEILKFISDPTARYYRCVDGVPDLTRVLVKLYPPSLLYVPVDDVLTALRGGANLLVFDKTDQVWEETMSEGVVNLIGPEALVGADHCGPRTKKRVSEVTGYTIDSVTKADSKSPKSDSKPPKSDSKRAKSPKSDSKGAKSDSKMFTCPPRGKPLKKDIEKALRKNKIAFNSKSTKQALCTQFATELREILRS